MSSYIPAIETLIVVTKTLTLLLGGLITYFAYKAYRRTGATALRMLTIGFAVVTVGSLAAGFLDQLLRVEFQIGLLVESLLVAVGFGVIVYSLYVTEG